MIRMKKKVMLIVKVFAIVKCPQESINVGIMGSVVLAAIIYWRLGAVGMI